MEQKSKRCYPIHRVFAAPDWSALPLARMEPLWIVPTSVSACAQLAYDDERLYAHLHAQESQIRAEGTGPLDQPCLDSCLEWFFSPLEGDKRYLNIEMNPNCCLYLGLGTGRGDLVRLLPQGGARALNARCVRTPDGWDLYYELPYRLIRLFFPEFVPAGRLHGNFYKCGDLTAQEHYLAWNPVEVPTPDFHRPEFFGDLLFV